MIVTPDGIRMLEGAERSLYRGAIGMMVDWMVDECRGECGQWVYGIDWFDQWEPGQRFLLLEFAARSLLTPEVPASLTAVKEATLDAIRVEIQSLVRLEIRDGSMARPDSSWRRDVIAAYQAQTEREPTIQEMAVDMDGWQKVIASVHDRIVGPCSYLKCEAYRDDDPAKLSKYLQQRGLPEDFLTWIPPLQSVDQTQRSIERIQNLVFET